MHPRHATHAEAVYIARAMNLRIERVWQILQGHPEDSLTDLEQLLRAADLNGTDRPPSPSKA